MGFCSYSNEFSQSSYTNVENQFIQKYMVLGEGDAVKVYLFGLYLCQNVQGDYSLAEAARTLNLPEQVVADYFRFWEDFDLLEIVSYEPFSVRYFPADYSKGKPKRIRSEKYADFNKALQSLMPKKMISASEFMKYFSVMEEYGIKPEAMLLIVRYCIDLKGENISANYILQVARNFAGEGATTVEQVENKLTDYVVRSDELVAVLRAMGSSKAPEPEDHKLFKKWSEEFGFDKSAILYTAGQIRRGGIAKLDETLTELYANKKFGEAEIKEYLSGKAAVRNLTISVAKELGVYCAVVDTYTDNFVSGWLAAGFDGPSLLQLAKYCFRREKKSFEKMDELIQKLVSLGVVSAESIAAYMEAEARERDFAGEVLRAAGIARRVNNWDRDCLRNWRHWGFSDEMILKAAALAEGKASPVPYITSVLSSWKAKNIFSPDQIAASDAAQTRRPEKDEKEEEAKRRVQSYYFNLREKAQDRADHYRKLAEADHEFSQNEELLRTTEIELAKAEALGGDVKTLSDQLRRCREARVSILERLHLREEMLVPQYRCKKCNDTGFDRNGNVCDCYRKFVSEASADRRLETILDAYSDIDI